MNRNIKKVLAVVLTLVMLMSSFVVCFAAVEVNEEAAAKHYGQYKNYLLLGDSAASGYRDEMSDNDKHNNDLYMDSTYCRYEGSYADIIADTIIEDGSMTALAAPGFRTIEMRYMLEDDFAAECTDPYLFHPSHLYVYKNQVCECHGVNMLPGSEHFRDEFKNSIAKADLITLGIGGNDWGAYLGWVLTDLMAEKAPSDKYVEFAAEIAEILNNGVLDLSSIEQLLEIAHIIGVLPNIVMELPQILDYGLGNFYKNWNVMIEDIYELNPEVTLMVVGMSDNAVKGKYYDYPEAGVVGEAVPPMVADESMAGAMDIIVDFIMGVGNGPMIEGAKKYGYTFVNIDGTTYVDSHPDADGHVNIANKIIEALPDKDISAKFEDMKPGNKYYASVEYCVANGIMSGLTDTTFGADEAITSGQLNAAINAIAGTKNSTDSTSKATMLELALAMLTGGAKKGFVGFFKGAGLMLEILYTNGYKVKTSVSRGQAAVYFCELAKF